MKDEDGDLEAKATMMRKALGEFMDEEHITLLEKNAVDEAQMALELFPKKPDEFYMGVMNRAEYDRYRKALRACTDLMKSEDFFFGWNPFKSKEKDGFLDTRKQKKVIFCSLQPYDDDEIRNRLIFYYGKEKK